jgi:hypothetical protein
LRWLWLAIIPLAFFFCGATRLAADDSGLWVASADTTVSTLKAPTLFTRAFFVTNPSSESREIVDSVVLPASWRPVARDSSFSLQPRQQDLRLVAVAIPAETPPGPYELIYIVKDVPSSGIAGQCEIDIVVLPVTALKITPREAPARVLAGEEYTARFYITQQGNADVRLTLSIRSSLGFPAQLSRYQTEVSPGKSAQVVATVKTDRNTRDLSADQLVLTATLRDSVMGPTSVLGKTSVQIIPRVTEPENVYRRVPSKMAVRFIHDKDLSGYQAEYSGTGTLDTRNRWRVDYLIRGPHNLEQNIYGQRDEYYVGVQNKDAELRAGDLLFSLSPLLEQHRLGRGVRATAVHGSIQSGGYSFRARESYPDLEETGGYASLQSSRFLGTRLNYLNKKTTTSRNTLGSIFSTITPSRDLNVDLEYALSTRDGTGSRKLAPAFFTRASGKFQGARLSFNKIYAHPEFSGYYRDQDYSMVELLAPLTRGWRYHASYRWFVQNIDRDTTQSTAIRENHLQSGLTHDFRWGTTATFEIEDLRRIDKFLLSGVRQRMRTACLRARQDIRWVSLNASVKRGIGWDYAQGTTSALESYNLGVNYTPDPWQSYYASFQTGNAGSSVGMRRIRTVAVSANYRLIQWLSLSASLQKSDWGHGSDFENDLLSLDARCTLSRYHVVSLRFRKQDYKRANLGERTSFVMSYEIPVGMPIAKIRETGSVKGRVFDAEDTEHKGLSGVLLSLGGMTTLTDRNGNYVFASVTPGEQYLQVESASIGLDRVTLQKSPVEVRVRGGKTEKVDLAVIRSGTIEGQVSLFGLAQNESSQGIFVESGDSTSGQANAPEALARLRGMSNLELILKSEREILSTTTDQQGRFYFDELRPGKWELHVVPDDLPAHHSADPSIAELTLSPGSRQEVTVKVIPQTRRILIVDEGRVPVVTRPK